MSTALPGSRPHQERGERAAAKEGVVIAATAILRELVERPQWVVWRWEERNGKQTKPPYCAITGKLASSTDPTDWTTFEKALVASENAGWNGVGFVFTPDDPFAGVDLDKCRNPLTGEIDPKAREIIRGLNSYTEVSPSGTGLKVFVKGKLPPGGRKRGDLEMYDCKRYFTVTGEHLEGTPATIEDRTEELGALHARFFAKPEPTNLRPTRTDIAGPDLSDAQIIEKAHAASNEAKFARLWRGDTSGYPSPSEADSALCVMLGFWTGGDPHRVDWLFRQSGLYREKWDEGRGGETYGTRTIAHALEITTEVYEPRQPSDNGASPDPPAEGDEIRETDLGNAARLVQRHGRDIRYCYPQFRWRVWDSARWAQDDTGEVQRRAKGTVRAIYHEAAKAEGDRSRALAKHALKSEAEARIDAMVALARSEPSIPVTPKQLDADPWLLNVQNGTIDLCNGQLREHRRENLITKLAPITYDPKATCPHWLKFLDRIMDGNADLIDFIKKAIGYTLTGDVSEQVLFFQHGAGANGKSTLSETVLALLGDYGKQAAPGLLTVRYGERHPTEIADLAGARFVASVEVDEGRRLAEALMKWLTGGDRVKARHMRQDFFEFTPTHKLWLAANHKPTIVGSDLAVWRRIRLIPFNVVIPPAEQDRDLPAKLRTELPGILNWALEGCLRWQQEGLNPPQEVQAATEEYRAEQDIVAGFIDDCCRLGENEKATASGLYAAYRQWCEDNGEKPMTQRRFGNRLSEHGLSGGHVTGSKRWWHGVGLATQIQIQSNADSGKSV